MNTLRATRGTVERRSVESAPVRRGGTRRPDLRVVDRRQRSARRRAMSVVAALASVALFVSLFGLAVFHTYLVDPRG